MYGKLDITQPQLEADMHAFSHPLHRDDRAAIVSNADVTGTGSLFALLQHDFWGQDITLSDSHKSFRPLTTLSFRLNHSLHGLDAWGYHLGNVFIFAMTCVLVYLFALRW